MTKFVDLTGQRFTRLVAIEPAGERVTSTGKVLPLWRCHCDCGKEIVKAGPYLLNGDTKSCGCYQREMAAKAKTTHGMRSKGALPPEYVNWRHMVDRCTNPNRKDFHYYGGAGVTVCWRWRNSFTDFLEDMGPRPTPKHSIDRIDGAKGYEPGNCRWATPTEQSQNRKSAVMITFNGETLCAAEWARRTGILQNTITRRIKAGWRPERALTVR